VSFIANISSYFPRPEKLFFRGYLPPFRIIFGLRHSRAKGHFRSERRFSHGHAISAGGNVSQCKVEMFSMLSEERESKKDRRSGRGQIDTKR
jgi:hypothetical protein